MPPPPPPPPPKRWRWPGLRVTIAAIVTVIWATAYTVSIFNPHYEPNPAITSVELLVVAYLFVTERQKRNGQ